MGTYSFHDYNKYFSLKVPLLLWFLIFYSLRHALLLLVFAPTLQTVDALTDETQWAYYMCSIPAILLLAALSNRVPSAGKITRGIWQQGKHLLEVSLLLHLGINILLSLLKPVWHPSLTQTLLLLIDVSGLVYLHKSRHVHDLFVDFPTPGQKTGDNKTSGPSEH